MVNVARLKAEIKDKAVGFDHVLNSWTRHMHGNLNEHRVSCKHCGASAVIKLNDERDPVHESYSLGERCKGAA